MKSLYFHGYIGHNGLLAYCKSSRYEDAVAVLTKTLYQQQTIFIGVRIKDNMVVRLLIYADTISATSETSLTEKAINSH